MFSDIGAIYFHQYWCNIGNVGQCCIILPQYWRNIAFIGQFAPICSILDQYYANIACYTGNVIHHFQKSPKRKSEQAPQHAAKKNEPPKRPREE